MLDSPGRANALVDVPAREGNDVNADPPLLGKFPRLSDGAPPPVVLTVRQQNHHFAFDLVRCRFLAVLFRQSFLDCVQARGRQRDCVPDGSAVLVFLSERNGLEEWLEHGMT